MTGIVKVYLFVIFLVLGAVAGAAPASVTKSYDEWKSEKIQVAKSQLSNSKAKLTASVSGGKNTPVELVRELAQQEFNLDVAEALSVTDYLVLYLSNQPGKSKFKEAAARLSPEETAKIMEAFIKTMQAEKDEEKESSRRSSAIELLN